MAFPCCFHQSCFVQHFHQSCFVQHYLVFLDDPIGSEQMCKHVLKCDAVVTVAGLCGNPLMRASIPVTVATNIVVIGGCSNGSCRQSTPQKVLSYLCKVGDNSESCPRTSFAVIHSVSASCGSAACRAHAMIRQLINIVKISYPRVFEKAYTTLWSLLRLTLG
jgi:hypothetical protein